MDLAPLLQASPPIQLHAWSALAAIVLGIPQLRRAKGTAGHRLVGVVWVGLVATACVSSFWIHEIEQWRGFSWIHLLAVLTLVGLARGLWALRAGSPRAHRSAMLWVFVGGLGVAGSFAFWPDRIMHQVVFGG
ncbi:MAG: DUF2306 domain-containing protein [Alphaproteobacteria bacterium]|nr:DUF2306 domain-containing protein [Alphaproteobacteria bacterium]